MKRAAHTRDKITRAMNKALAKIGKTKEPLVSSAARRILEHSKW
jgi:hypothetical protein